MRQNPRIHLSGKNGMEKSSFDWKFYAMLIPAIAGVVLPVLLWQVDLASRALSVRLISSVALQPAPSQPIQDLQMTLDGVKIDSPYLSTLEISNEGSKPISTSDFESPLVISLAPGATNVRARITSRKPLNINGVLAMTPSAVTLQPLLLNPSDSLTLAIISSGTSPVFDAQARISGISKVSYEDSTPEKRGWLRGAGLLGVALLAFSVYMHLAVALILPFRITRPWAIAAMLVCAFGGTALMRRAFATVGLEASGLNVVAYIVAAAITGTPWFYFQMRRVRRAPQF
jgi:hypothetical protein